MLLNRTNAPADSLKMMSVVGGGDTTLASLTHPAVAQLTALDMNPNQMHLFQLKMAVAISSLSQAQAVDFLNFGINGESILKDKLPSLPEETRAFFTEHLDEIENGVLDGRNDNPFNKNLRPFFKDECNLDLETFPSMTTAERERLVEICYTSDAQSFLDNTANLFDKLPWFQQLPEENQKHMKNIMAGTCLAGVRGLGNLFHDINRGVLPPSDFYMDVLRCGTFTALPPWLNDSARNILRQKADKLTVHLGKIEELEDAKEYDVVTLSNIYDFSPVPNAVESIKGIVGQCLKPGGELLIRRATGEASACLEQAGGRLREGETLGQMDQTPLFYRTGDTVSSAKFQ